MTPATLPTAGASSCSYTPAAERFDCTPVTVNGLTITRSYQLLDAAGKPLSTPDPMTIAAIRTITDAKGTLAPPPGAPPSTIMIDRHEDATMSGLRTAHHVINGTATQKLDFTIPTGTTSIHETSTTSDLRLPEPTAASKWPLGGTISSDRTMTIVVTGGSNITIVSKDVITFDGTSVMTFTHTQGGTTTTCKLDLAKTLGPVCQ
jgi:hypothetical protein